MKKIKALIILSLVFFLTGCTNWNDIKSNYSDVLSKNPSCTYTGQPSDSAVTHFTKIEFNASLDGISVKYNGGSSNRIVDDKGNNPVHYINNYSITYNNFNAENFLNEYKQTNTCPTNIYACIDNNANISVSDHKMDDLSCYTYRVVNSAGTTGSTNVKDPNTNSSCYVTNAKSCKRFTVRESLPNAPVYLELGKENLGGSTGNYFVISHDGWATGSVGRASNNYGVTDRGDTFLVQDQSIFDDGITVNDLNFTYTDAGGSYVIYISKKGSTTTTPGDFQGGSADNATQSDVTVTPPSSVVTSPSNEELDIKDINFCSETGVLKTLQIIGYVLYIIKIVIPLLLLILAIKDFATAVISSDDKANSNAISKVIRRVLTAIIIFFIPTFLNIALRGLDDLMASQSNYSSCTTCLLDPTNCSNASLQVNPNDTSENQDNSNNWWQGAKPSGNNPPSTGSSSTGNGNSSSGSTTPTVTSNYVWPIGSNDTTGNNIYLGEVPKDDLTVNSGFGLRWINGEQEQHAGIDINGALGDKVIAAKEGTVVYTYNGCPTDGYLDNPCGGYRGNRVYVYSEGGILMIYQHLKQDSIVVKEGDKVNQGQLLGEVGSSGSSTGYHLHFEVRTGSSGAAKIDGTAVDPLQYINASSPR